MDPDEINRFRQLSSAWWNETGEYAALHSLNQLRVPFVREQLLQSAPTTIASNLIKPLTGFRLLDIGCGGGILAEVRLISSSLLDFRFVFSRWLGSARRS